MYVCFEKVHEKMRPLNEKKIAEPASKNSLQIVNEVSNKIQLHK